MEFFDRLLKCCDCSNEFVFTAGEQLFFFDKQFKNDPKRCKLCKAKRAGLRPGPAASAAMLPLSKTETRTRCSACDIETTVPFRPTQGRPVLCRSCFQLKRVPSAVAAVANMDSPAELIAEASEALERAVSAGALDGGVGRPAPESSSATVEMIAGTSLASRADGVAVPAELLAAAAEVSQA